MSSDDDDRKSLILPAGLTTSEQDVLSIVEAIQDLDIEKLSEEDIDDVLNAAKSFHRAIDKKEITLKRVKALEFALRSIRIMLNRFDVGIETRTRLTLYIDEVLERDKDHDREQRRSADY